MRPCRRPRQAESPTQVSISRGSGAQGQGSLSPATALGFLQDSASIPGTAGVGSGCGRGLQAGTVRNQGREVGQGRVLRGLSFPGVERGSTGWGEASPPLVVWLTPPRHPGPWRPTDGSGAESRGDTPGSATHYSALARGKKRRTATRIPLLSIFTETHMAVNQRWMGFELGFQRRAPENIREQI